jgi:hypothetical protein
MSTAQKTPLVAGRTYVDRKERRWYIERIVNAGVVFSGIALPAMALARCLDSVPGSKVVRLPQWFDAVTWRWTFGNDPTDLDLVRAA